VTTYWGRQPHQPGRQIVLLVELVLPGLRQKIYDLQMLAAVSHVERGPAVVSLCAEARAGVDKASHRSEVASQGREVARRPAALVHGIGRTLWIVLF
jgi:hypothetical protein